MSLFTLHVIWPFLWIWATLYQPERGWGMQSHVASQEKATEPEIG
ncbi:inner membrane yiaW domain protein [Shigella flexneri K-1770]|nr:inner membrane yiaW domain protein [Shigella flexneri K-1770]